jgi:hypothetical protein
MEDIREYLKDKDAISACFNIEGNKCRMTIATESQEHLKEIVNEWNEVKVEGSDLHYIFRQIGFLSREEQICVIQSQLEKGDDTALITSEEQRVSDICAENGASAVYYRFHGDKIEFYVTGALDEEVMNQLKSIDKTYEHIYMNPPRCRFKITGTEMETLGSVGPIQAEPVVESGERLL